MEVFGKNIKMRLVDECDAEFLISLRVDPRKNKHLSHVDDDVEKQRLWIKEYKPREKAKLEYYFIVEDNQGEPVGCLRIYDFQGESFSWGSWIVKDGSPSYVAIESALQVYEYAFYQLGFEKCHFEVQKGNDRVKAFHERFGAMVSSEDELQHFFTYSKSDYEAIKPKYRRFLG
jgi:RimJ/RimL family protein N-acetyltransferase